MKVEARDRLEVIHQVEQLVRAGMRVSKAITAVVERAAIEAKLRGEQRPFGESTVYSWIQRVRASAVTTARPIWRPTMWAGRPARRSRKRPGKNTRPPGCARSSRPMRRPIAT